VTSPIQQASSSSGDSSSSSSTGIVAGAVAGGIVGATLFGGIIFFLYYHKKQRTKTQQAPEASESRVVAFQASVPESTGIGAGVEAGHGRSKGEEVLSPTSPASYNRVQVPVDRTPDVAANVGSGIKSQQHAGYGNKVSPSALVPSTINQLPTSATGRNLVAPVAPIDIPSHTAIIVNGRDDNDGDPDDICLSDDEHSELSSLGDYFRDEESRVAVPTRGADLVGSGYPTVPIVPKPNGTSPIENRLHQWRSTVVPSTSPPPSSALLGDHDIDIDHLHLGDDDDVSHISDLSWLA
jgi:hypothetical protein